MRQVIQSSVWIVPALLLFAVAWTRFNTPPTNRSGTTFALFFFGVIFYYALILALWLLVVIAVKQGGIGFDKISVELGHAEPLPPEEIAQFAPIVAALIIVVASQFRRMFQIDAAARSFCVRLAAIPREADRLAVELAQRADFLPPKGGLRHQVGKIISENISPQALNFNRDGTLSARFTRAISLYCLFIGPHNNGTPLEFPANAHGRSAYARIMQLGEATAARTNAHYEELVHVGLAYFTAQHPTKELKERLNRTITEISNLICSLIARYVLFCDRTRRARRQHLSSMGFDANHPMPSFGRDQWAGTILAVVALSVAMMVWMPGTRPLAAGEVLTIAITFAISIGFAVMAAVLVAQRFIERLEGEKPTYPPLAELTLAALVVAGLSVALRIAVPLVPALVQGDSSGLQHVFTQFWERLAGVITPFTCTISLGLLCAYVDLPNRSWLRVAAVGALGNGIALMGAGLLVGWLIEERVLLRFFHVPIEQARYIIIVNTGITGAVIGAMVLAAFKKSERARRNFAEGAVLDPHLRPDEHASPAEGLDTLVPRPSEVARQNFGGYSRPNVQELEGRYVCFRPAFACAGVISVYQVVLRWDEAESCLMFEEQGRADVAHTQKGRVYIPDGRPFMSLVTVEKGAIRLIMVSRPEQQQPARGLILTLSNPGGMHFTPSSAPIVLKRATHETPQLGYVRSDAPDYDAYRRELEQAMRGFGCFAAPPPPVPDPALAAGKPAEEVRLSVVR